MFTQENGGERFANKTKFYYTATDRFVFYQAGKCLVQTLLLNHSKISLLKVTESKTDLVSSIGWKAKTSTVQGLPPIESRTNLETLLIGFYAGKAGELFTGYTQKDANQHLCSLKYEAKAVIMQPRKHFVRVIGSFANGITFPAKFRLNKKTQLLQITNTATMNRCNKTKGTVMHSGNKTEGTVMHSKAVHHLFVQPSVLINDLVVQKQANLLQGKIKQFLCQSDTGLFERVKATFLAQYIIVNGSISSQNIFNLKKNSIVGNLNKTEIKDKRVSDLFQNLEEDLKDIYFQGNFGVTGSTSYKNSVFARHNSFNKESVTQPKLVSEPSSSGALQSNNLLESKKINFISQKKEITYKCEEIVCKALTFSIKPYGDWFRIYLPQIETYQRQLLLSDQFFKKRRELGCAKTLLCKNSVMQERSFCKTKLDSASKESTKKTDIKTSSLHKALLCHNSYLDDLNSKHRNEVLLIPSLRPCTERCCTKTLFLRDKILTPIPTCLWPQELGYGICHGLVLNTFYRAFNLLGKNRELLDILTDHLIRFGKIRAPEILRICALYVDTANTFASSVNQNHRVPNR